MQDTICLDDGVYTTTIEYAQYYVAYEYVLMRSMDFKCWANCQKDARAFAIWRWKNGGGKHDDECDFGD